MLITLSRKHLIILLMAVLVIILGVLATPNVRDFFFTDPVRTTIPGIEGSRALEAVQAMYSLDYTQSLDDYIEAVCQGMTPDGCQLFSDLFAPILHNQALAQRVQTGSSVVFVETAAVSISNSQIWHLRVVVEQPWEGLKKPLDLFAEVVLEGDDWLLVRVLFEEEGSRFPAPTP